MQATLAAPRQTLRLGATAPMDWDLALRFLTPRALSPLEAVEGSTWVRRVAAGRGSGLLRVAPGPGDDALSADLSRIPGRYRGGVARRLAGALDLEAPVTEIRRVLERDPLLRPRLRAGPGIRVITGLDPFEVAVRAVVGQQVSVAGARTVCERLVRRCGRGPADEDPAWTFPDAPRLAGADLDGLGLTGARAATVVRLARAVSDGAVVLDPTRPVAAVREELMALKGIGAWTADYVAMRGLGDRDGFPAGDLGLRRASGLDTKALEARAERWRPWRAYAAALLWLVDGPDAAAVA